MSKYVQHLCVCGRGAGIFKGTLIKLLVENLTSSILVSMETVSLIAFQI